MTVLFCQAPFCSSGTVCYFRVLKRCGNILTLKPGYMVYNLRYHNKTCMMGTINIRYDRPTDRTGAVYTHTHQPIWAHTHLPTSWRKSSWPTAVDRCVRNFTSALLRRLTPIQMLNLQSVLEKEVSGDNLAPQAYIR